MGADPAVLQTFPIFAGLSREQCERIAGWCEEREVEAGDRLTPQGASGYTFFLIEEGTAEVSRDGEHLAELGPGDFLGEGALLGESGRRNASVVAASPMRLAVMYGTAFRQLEAELPEVAERIRGVMLARLASS
jgi:CRP-like cAMP-binding protein